MIGMWRRGNKAINLQWSEKYRSAYTTVFFKLPLEEMQIEPLSKI